MRLLVYSDAATVGGAELALGYLLAELDPGIEVGVLATAPEVARAIAAHRPGSPHGAVPAPRGEGDIRALRAHIGAIAAFAPDVLHANQAWPWACAYAEVAALRLGVRVLAVDHLPVDGAIPRRRRAARRALDRRLHGHVSVGERAARRVEEIVGLAPGSVGAVANGVPDPPAGDPPPEAREDAALVVGSLGRLTAQKDFAALVRALPDLEGTRLVLVGDGPERPAVERLAGELGVADRLRITGWTPDARAWLGGFDVFALPSRWEGMPLSILEAMHAGLPVVASDVGSVAEAVVHGQTGFVVAPGDEGGLRRRVRELLGDPLLRARMGTRGRELAGERFTARAMARRYEAVYARLARPTPASRGSSTSAA